MLWLLNWRYALITTSSNGTVPNVLPADTVTVGPPVSVTFRLLFAMNCLESGPELPVGSLYATVTVVDTPSAAWSELEGAENIVISGVLALNAVTVKEGIATIMESMAVASW
jgi:hypothetical protein